ncbi:MAG: EAL domain-containing protein, partial [Oceanospirillales bacterium]
WQHPERGLLAPAEFLPIIEDHPLAIKLGEWVIETALSQIENWQYQGLDIPISVNISALQLQHVDFIERLKALLSAHPSIPSGYLEIEVLETSALEDIDNISLVIEECRKLDVAFALDDFGTGYSSLTYLKRLSVKMLKIDKSFVRDMLYDRDDLSILEGVIGLANAFRRTVIAEGVETIEHGEMLLQLGCELAQGYGIARPMHADKMPKWIETWCSPKSWQKCQRLSFDKLMMLHATVEHRAWLIAFEHYLKNENSHPPPLDHHLCHYGQWLDNERSQETAHLPEFDDIDTLHQQVHFLAAELYQLHTDGQQEKALSRLEELYKLRDKLIQTMKNMLLK